MKFSRPARQHVVTLEMTAMIDIILLLIIFFMTTAQFVQRARADLELPKERGEDEARVETPPLVINILHEGQRPFIVGDQQLDTAQVLVLIDREIARLRLIGSDASALELTVRADRRGLSRALNDLGSHLRDRGVTHWRLATEQPR